jgi:methylmalonyl-CoA decarboxylase subunit alpha
VSDHTSDELAKISARALAGGAPKYHEKNTAEGKLFVRKRLELLLDDGARACSGYQ